MPPEDDEDGFIPTQAYLEDKREQVGIALLRDVTAPEVQGAVVDVWLSLARSEQEALHNIMARVSMDGRRHVAGLMLAIAERLRRSDELNQDPFRF